MRGARAKEGEKEDHRVRHLAPGQLPSFTCRRGMEKAPCLPVQLPRVTQDLPRPFPCSYSKAPEHSHDQVLLRATLRNHAPASDPLSSSNHTWQEQRSQRRHLPSAQAGATRHIPTSPRDRKWTPGAGSRHSPPSPSQSGLGSQNWAQKPLRSQAELLTPRRGARKRPDLAGGSDSKGKIKREM